MLFSDHRSRSRSLLFAAALASVLLLGNGTGIRGDVIVLSNRTAQAVRVTVGNGAAWWLSCQLRPQETIALSLPPAILQVMLHDAAPGSGEVVFACETNRAYYIFETDGGERALGAIGLAGRVATYVELQHLAASLARLPSAALPNEPPFTLKLKLAVDDEELARTEVWQQRLARRLERAGAVLGRQLGIRLQVVAFDRWESDDEVDDLEFALAEFSWEVSPEPAHVAVGFTSQFRSTREELDHLGRSHGPLQPHILIREFLPGMTERDYVEILVHELGHFFGAAHSPEPNSVMRPQLGDKKAVVKSFLIQLDPLNCLAAALVVEELRKGDRMPRSLADLDPLRRHYLAQIYETLKKALPEDDSAERFLVMARPPVFTEPSGFTASLRRVVRAVVAEAERWAGKGLDGEQLAERYIRAAARQAQELPEEHRIKAFLVGIAIALDRQGLFRTTPWLNAIYAGVESNAERAHRLEVLGTPTAHGREDLLLHFAFSAALHALLGRNLAWEAGLMKELQDAQGGSGFSFADLAADLAGLKLADQLVADESFLGTLAEQFRPADFIPSPEGLPEGLKMTELRRRYGHRSDARFQAAVETLQALVDQLPAYRP